MLAIVLGLLGFGLVVTSAALAAPSQPPLASTGPGPLFSDPLTDTDSISPTIGFSHPVASAMAQFFEVEYTEIMTLHQQGLGFGVIAHAYFISQTAGISATAVLAEFQSGMGWGTIMKKYGWHPGHGENLGAIMSNKDQTGPPGQNKKGQGEADFTPPGQFKKGGQDSDDDQGGPPTTPRGHNRGKGKK
jgi:hypothetical protein